MVLYTLDAVYAYLTDGDTRKLDHLKKKKLMHLSSMPIQFPELIALYEKHQLKDSDVRRALDGVRAASKSAQLRGAQDAPQAALKDV